MFTCAESKEDKGSSSRIYSRTYQTESRVSINNMPAFQVGDTVKVEAAIETDSIGENTILAEDTLLIIKKIDPDGNIKVNKIKDPWPKNKWIKKRKLTSLRLNEKTESIDFTQSQMPTDRPPEPLLKDETKPLLEDEPSSIITDTLDKEILSEDESYMETFDVGDRIQVQKSFMSEIEAGSVFDVYQKDQKNLIITPIMKLRDKTNPEFSPPVKIIIQPKEFKNIKKFEDFKEGDQIEVLQDFYSNGKLERTLLPSGMKLEIIQLNKDGYLRVQKLEDPLFATDERVWIKLKNFNRIKKITASEPTKKKNNKVLNEKVNCFLYFSFFNLL